MHVRVVLALVSLFWMGEVVSATAGDAESLAELRQEYADVLALSGTAKAEILALARLLRKQPAMAIDLSHIETPQYCLNTGGDMLHIAATSSAAVPLAYFHPAAPLVAAGLDVSKLEIEPEKPSDLKPDRWYYYPGGRRMEPFHGAAIGSPMLIRTIGLP